MTSEVFSREFRVVQVGARYSPNIGRDETNAAAGNKCVEHVRKHLPNYRQREVLNDVITVDPMDHARQSGPGFGKIKVSTGSPRDICGDPSPQTNATRAYSDVDCVSALADFPRQATPSQRPMHVVQRTPSDYSRNLTDNRIHH